MLVTAPGRGMRDIRRVVVLLFVLIRCLQAAARERIGIRVRLSTRCAEDAAQTNLVAGPTDNRLDNGQVGYNDGHECLTAGPSTARDRTVRASLSPWSA